MTIFPDSNIFIHFKPIENWDWELYINQKLKIVICMCVINEIDKVKYSANTNITKRRVQDLIRKFNSSSLNVFNNIPFSIFVPDNLFELFHDANLDKEDKDDVFIASVLSFQKEYPQENICIISNDLGVQLKCKAYKIKYEIPAMEYLIQEDDTLTKEIRKLTVELNRLKNLQPSLRLQFDNGETFKQFDIKEPWKKYEDFIFNKMERLKMQYPYIEAETNENPYVLSLLNLYKKTPDKVEKYNKDLEKFYSDYEVYLRDTKESILKVKLTIVLNIDIMNTGSTPAENVDLYMHFPDGFSLINKDEYSSKDLEPLPPELSAYSLAPFDFNNSIPQFVYPKVSDISLSRFSIKKTNSYDVNDHFAIIKHNHLVSVCPLYLNFDTFDDVKNFEIKYTITAANVVDKIDGVLNVVFTKIPYTQDDEILIA